MCQSSECARGIHEEQEEDTSEREARPLDEEQHKKDDDRATNLAQHPEEQ